MKKFLALIACVVALGAFASCGSNTDKPEDSTGTEQTTDTGKDTEKDTEKDTDTESDNKNYVNPISNGGDFNVSGY